MWAIDPDLFAGIVGSTDTEVVFRLALTFGLEEDPIRALERTVGLIEATAAERGVAPMVQGTFGVSDGSSLWATRYATEGRARSLFASADIDSLHQLYPDKKMWFATATSTDRLIASEPFSRFLQPVDRLGVPRVLDGIRRPERLIRVPKPVEGRPGLGATLAPGHGGPLPFHDGLRISANLAA
jgi:hypothetical protein